MPEMTEYGNNDLKERVLNMWSGFFGPPYSSSEIGAELGVTRNKVIGIVNRARAKGDQRAVFRGPPPALRLERRPARKDPPHFVPPTTHDKPVSDSDPVNDLSDNLTDTKQPPPMLSAAFCFSTNNKAKTLFNIGLYECHYPLESVTNDGFRMYCGRDARDVFLKKKKSYCAEHYGRMFYYKAKTIRRVTNNGAGSSNRRDG